MYSYLFIQGMWCMALINVLRKAWFKKSVLNNENACTTEIDVFFSNPIKKKHLGKTV